MSLEIATELIAHVAAYLSGREAAGPGGGSYSGRGKKSDLLALRVASKDCRDAVRRAVKTHASCEDISLAPGLHGTYDRPECVAAVGRVFGAGCRDRGCPRLDYISGDVRFHKARNSDEATSPFDSGLLDAIYEVGDLLEERGGGMGLMIGRPADPPRF